MEKVNRGEWTPAKAESARGLATAAAPTFQVEASQWLHRRKVRAGDLDGRSKTMRDLEWRLSVVMDKFGPAPIDELDFGLADELVVELCEERGAIERAAAEGVPLMRAARDARIGSQLPGASARHIQRIDSQGTRCRRARAAGREEARRARRRGTRAEVRGAEGRAPAALVLEPEQIAAVLRAADLIEAEHRGLTWEAVDLIRSSSRSAVSLARELGRRTSSPISGTCRRPAAVSRWGPSSPQSSETRSRGSACRMTTRRGTSLRFRAAAAPFQSSPRRTLRISVSETPGSARECTHGRCPGAGAYRCALGNAGSRWPLGYSIRCSVRPLAQRRHDRDVALAGVPRPTGDSAGSGGDISPYSGSVGSKFRCAPPCSGYRALARRTVDPWDPGCVRPLLDEHGLLVPSFQRWGPRSVVS